MTERELFERILSVFDRMQPYLRHVPDQDHIEIEELRAAIRAAVERHK